jgi:hypothetical protein
VGVSMCAYDIMRWLPDAKVRVSVDVGEYVCAQVFMMLLREAGVNVSEGVCVCM